jgi:hypothetical protein
VAEKWVVGGAEARRFDDGEATSQEAFAFGGLLLHVRPPEDLGETPDSAESQVRGIFHREVGGLGGVETTIYPCQLAEPRLGKLLCRRQRSGPNHKFIQETGTS